MVPASGQLGALGVEIITQYAGQEQVDLAVLVDVPGSWFGAGADGGLAAAEKKEKYRAQAVQFAEVREFKKARAKATKEPGIRFICLSDAQDDGEHEGFWMPLFQWNRYRHDTYKNDRQAELPFIRDKQVAAEAAVSPAPVSAPAPEGIFVHFELVSTGKHVQQSRCGGAPKEVVCSWFRCCQKGCTRRPDQLIREVGKGTGQLFRELKKCNRPLWRTLRLASSKSKLRLDENGEEVEAWTFKQSLIHHVRFVKWCIMDWQPFARCRSARLKAWAHGLNVRAGLPHRETSIKLMNLMRKLSDARLQKVRTPHGCARTRTAIPSPFAPHPRPRPSTSTLATLGVRRSSRCTPCASETLTPARPATFGHKRAAARPSFANALAWLSSPTSFSRSWARAPVVRASRRHRP